MTSGVGGVSSMVVSGFACEAGLVVGEGPGSSGWRGARGRVEVSPAGSGEGWWSSYIAPESEMFGVGKWRDGSEIIISKWEGIDRAIWFEVGLGWTKKLGWGGGWAGRFWAGLGGFEGVGKGLSVGPEVERKGQEEVAPQVTEEEPPRTPAEGFQLGPRIASHLSLRGKVGCGCLSVSSRRRAVACGDAASLASIRQTARMGAMSRKMAQRRQRRGPSFVLRRVELRMATEPVCRGKLEWHARPVRKSSRSGGDLRRPPEYIPRRVPRLNEGGRLSSHPPPPGHSSTLSSLVPSGGLEIATL
ncbi:hypothetical protein K2173_005683 [Erythroxylum novogranatense]|uniref:Uncharacterized protein n=1 Tax=Erythroxylum novogranatense TaxID=1862640 RepID=A0AAV8SQE6_9ROSI|nr:hypothetical protein K2173_005683 [Erythroxylum novogranatense]